MRGFYYNIILSFFFYSSRAAHLDVCHDHNGNKTVMRKIPLAYLIVFFISGLRNNRIKHIAYSSVVYTTCRALWWSRWQMSEFIIFLCTYCKSAPRRRIYYHHPRTDNNCTYMLYSYSKVYII